MNNLIVDDKRRCEQQLAACFQKLVLNVEPEAIQDISRIIIESMSGEWRSFHTADHIFKVGEHGDPIEVIAALYHDIVYYQVDSGLNINIAKIITPYLIETGGKLIVNATPSSKDNLLLGVTLKVFGYSDGQVLNLFNGLNEFLSALVALKSLERHLPVATLVEIAACIEATIPFRSIADGEISSSQQLFINLKTINEEFSLQWSEAKLIEVVERSVRLANSDVANFATEEASEFLDNTWNLIPETNHDLHNAPNYTILGYRSSMQKMEGFLSHLSPEFIFKQFKEEPSQEKFNLLKQRAKNNLDIASLYLSMKLTSIAVLEAISMRIGKNVAIGTMLGEAPLEDAYYLNIAEFLPSIDALVPPVDPHEQVVMDLLEFGRQGSSEFDIKNSPIATYMLKMIGFSEMRLVLKKCRAFLKNELTSEELIGACDPAMIHGILTSLTRLGEKRISLLRLS